MQEANQRTAWCRRCRKNVRTEVRDGIEEYVLHSDQVGELTCNNSRRPVRR